VILDLPRFLAAARPVWEDLETTLKHLEAAPDTHLDVPSAERFYRHYQLAAAHLAEVRHLTAERELREYLENLVGRAYARIYVRSRRRTQGPWHVRAWRWWAHAFPSAVRRHAPAGSWSVGLFLAGCLFGALALKYDPQAKAALLPMGHGQMKPSERVKNENEDRGRRLSGKMGRFSAMLMTHNTRVAFFTLGLGMTFGAGTAVNLFYNGVILGGVAQDYVADGQAVFLLGWLLPHGSVEIPAILLAGQAGLVLGYALIGWGTREPRRRRLRQVLPDVMTLAGGVAILLVWAGLIEAFFSQYHEPVLTYAVKIAFGALELAALAAFLTLSGRGKESA
jgi:uncharacterized membrane protein SpoIIM required for sporulation